MHDDSSINSGSARKSGVTRAQSFMTDSFRMATSVLGPNAIRKAATLTVPNVKIIDKDMYKKQPECQVCFISFGKFGQHHCRICANAVCSSCSYSTINKQRACDICAYHYSDIDRQIFKQNVIKNLTGLCVEYLSNKNKAEEQLKTLEKQIPSQEEKQKQRRLAQQRMKKYNERLEELAQTKRRLEEQMEKMKQQ